MADRLELAMILEDDGEPAGPRVDPTALAPGPDSSGRLEVSGELETAAGELAAELRALRMALGSARAEGGAAEGPGDAAGLGGAAAVESGPIGVALALAARKAGEELGRLKEMAAGSVQAVRSLASNDNLGALTSATRVAADALGHIPVVGGALETGLKGLLGPVTAFAGVVQAFVDQARNLSGYSPELAQSTARADITSLLSDIREAQELGPDLARLQDAQTELISTVRELLLPVKKFVVEQLAEAMEFVVRQLRDAGLIWEEVLAVLKALPEVLGNLMFGRVEGATATIVTAIAGAKAAFEKRHERDEWPPPDFMREQIVQMVRGAFFQPPARNPDPVLPPNPAAFAPRGAF